MKSHLQKTQTFFITTNSHLTHLQAPQVYGNYLLSLPLACNYSSHTTSSLDIRRDPQKFGRKFVAIYARKDIERELDGGFFTHALSTSLILRRRNLWVRWFFEKFDFCEVVFVRCLVGRVFFGSRCIINVLRGFKLLTFFFISFPFLLSVALYKFQLENFKNKILRHHKITYTHNELYPILDPFVFVLKTRLRFCS